MSLIRRYDGITIFNGGHVGTRGKISSIQNSIDDIDEDFEDIGWEREVLNNSVEMIDAIFCESDYEYNLNLWGHYNQDCPYLKIGFENLQGCFRRN